MTGSFEAPRHDQPYPKDQINPGNPNIRIGYDAGIEDYVTHYRNEFAKLQAQAKPLLRDSPCASCWVTNPDKDAFFGLTGPDATPGIVKERYREGEQRLDAAVERKCPGPVEGQQEVVTYKEKIVPKQPAQSRLMRIIRTLAPKIGLPVKPVAKPEPKTITRNAVLRSPPHCGQDATRYQQR